MKNLKVSKIKASKGYTFYEIPGIKNLMFAEKESYLCLVGLEEDRNLWFRTGDRIDLAPSSLKDLFSVGAFNPATDKEKEEFVREVFNALGLTKVAFVENVKKGEFIRKVGTKKVYQKGAYCRFNKKYELEDYNDISRCVYLKKGTLVEIGFDF